MKPVVIAKTGSAPPEIAAARGDFDAWIRGGLDAASGCSTPTRVVDVPGGESLPDPDDCGGVVVTGSSSMVSDREPWSEAAAAWLERVHTRDVPILGICYGHQLLAHAFGGRVGPNPKGREIGTVEVALTAAGDPLLGALPPRLVVYETHRETVLELPAGASRLGANTLDENQAFRLGPKAWGVQFHPEFDADVMRRYLDARRAELEAEGLDTDALMAACRDSDHGRAILSRFAEIVRAAHG